MGHLTLAKGAVYSGFICVSHLLGLPLKPMEQVVYLLSALYLAAVLGAQFRSRAALVAIFAVLAFAPAFWSPGIGARVVRENLYVSLTLLLLASCIRVFVARAGARNSEAWRVEALTSSPREW
jgi:hypothetical protein